MERLTGAGGGGAFHVRGSRRAAVLKIGVEAPELAFYRAAADPLRARGVMVPVLLASGDDPAWILLQYFPGTLSRDRWGVDADVVQYLARWHAVAPSVLDAHPIPAHVFRWEDALLSLPQHPALGSVSAELDDIFSPVGWVHGDPNVTNWVATEDGVLALTDWARVGRAHPAVDLAILLPGLPEVNTFRQLAEAYCTVRPQAGPAPRLARLMAVAKWWTALEFLDWARQGRLNRDAEPGLRMLEARLPDWTRATFGSG